MVEENGNNGNGFSEDAEQLVKNAIADRGNKFTGGSSDLDPQRRVFTMENRDYKSVLQQLVNSIRDDAEFRQVLSTARWRSDEDWQDWCNAFAECERYGAPTGWLINRLIAQSAGIEGGKLKAILETISHTTYNINSNNSLNQKRGFLSFLGGRGNNGNNKQSPLS